MAYLLLIDTTETQRYIFGSNRMRENIGASYLVAQATTAWVLEEIETINVEDNVDRSKPGGLDTSRKYEEGLDIEVIYIAGGNSLIIFRDKVVLGQFVESYSEKLLREMPNAPIYAAPMAFDWQQVDQEKAMHKLVEQLFGEVADEYKRMRPRSMPLLGLGVSVACRSTGLPAITLSPPVRNAEDEEETRYPVSAEILAKLEAATPFARAPSHADAALRQQFNLSEELYRYPSDFDDMVPRKGEANYIAIVHADGDGIGKVVQQLGQGFDNRDYIEKRRAIAQQLGEATQEALRITQNKLVAYLHSERNELELRPVKNSAQDIFPFRPIVSAGDDITFVCDGRVGLDLATIYMREFTEKTKTIEGGPFSASAGVSIVRTHYPFARAYQLAEALSKQAKKYRRESGIEMGCLDWHFTVGGIYAPIDEIRQREYRPKDDNEWLTLRPVSLDTPQSRQFRHRTWPIVRKSIIAFQSEAWADKRNKAKALRDALRDGETAVERFCTMFNQTLPPIAQPQKWFQSGGYYRGRAGYFDGLELADWHISLELEDGN